MFVHCCELSRQRRIYKWTCFTFGHIFAFVVSLSLFPSLSFLQDPSLNFICICFNVTVNFFWFLEKFDLCACTGAAFSLHLPKHKKCIEMCVYIHCRHVKKLPLVIHRFTSDLNRWILILMHLLVVEAEEPWNPYYKEEIVIIFQDTRLFPHQHHQTAMAFE